MRRFSKEQLETYINDLEKSINTKPKIVDLVYYINSLLDRNKFSTYSEFSDNLVSDYTVTMYIKKYNLSDMLSLKKRSENAYKRKSKSEEQFEQQWREAYNVPENEHIEDYQQPEHKPYIIDKSSYQYPSMVCEDCSTADYGNSKMPKEFFDSLKDILGF